MQVSMGSPFGTEIDLEELESSIQDVIKITPILKQIYTGTGFNSEKTDSGSDEQDHELTEIAATDLVNKTYLRIVITGTAQVYQDDPATTAVQLKIQTKEVGGAYADSMAYKTVVNGQDGGSDDNINFNVCVIWYHTLTAGEIANGVQVKLFSKSDNGGTGSTHTKFTNITSSLEVI